jgi:hypothetical protein
LDATSPILRLRAQTWSRRACRHRAPLRRAPVLPPARRAFWDSALGSLLRRSLDKTDWISVGIPCGTTFANSQNVTGRARMKRMCQPSPRVNTCGTAGSARVERHHYPRCFDSQVKSVQISDRMAPLLQNTTKGLGLLPVFARKFLAIVRLKLDRDARGDRSSRLCFGRQGYVPTASFTEPPRPLFRSGEDQFSGVLPFHPRKVSTISRQKCLICCKTQKVTSGGIPSSLTPRPPRETSTDSLPRAAVPLTPPDSAGWFLCSCGRPAPGHWQYRSRIEEAA